MVRHPATVALLPFVSLVVLVSADESASCRLCPTGIDPPRPSDEAFDGPLGFFGVTCETVDDIVSNALDDDNLACGLVQSTLGTEACSCPPSEDDACPLCDEGESPADDLLDSAPIDLSLFGLPKITCQELFEDGDTLDCNVVEFIGNACGCRAGGDEEEEEEDELCSLCEDGERPSDVTDLVPIDLSDFGLENLSCKQLFEDGEIDCDVVDFARPLCGCGVFDDENEVCSLCPQGERPADFTDVFPIDLSGLGLENLSCEQLFEDGEIDCEVVDIARPLCGCGVFDDEEDGEDSDGEEGLCPLCPEPNEVPLPILLGVTPILDAEEVEGLSCADLYGDGGPNVPCGVARSAGLQCGCFSGDDDTSCVDAAKDLSFLQWKKAKGGNTVKPMSCPELALRASEGNDREVEFYCSNFGAVRNKCQVTCDNCRSSRPCEDSLAVSFTRFEPKVRSCRWLRRTKSNARRNRVCRQSADAKAICPLTCGECVP